VEAEKHIKILVGNPEEKKPGRELGGYYWNVSQGNRMWGCAQDYTGVYLTIKQLYALLMEGECGTQIKIPYICFL
jgi:hypothetical protein